MSETREEVMFGQLHDRRVEFLRDMDIGEIIDLFPTTEEAKELLIQEIVEAVYDSQINPEVK